jgi:AraC-like DNA-binding protein
VLILAAVRAPLLARLRHAAGRGFDFLPVSTWDEGVQAILRHPIEMGVADPQLEGHPRAQGIARFRALFPSVPIIVYTTLSPDLASVLLHLGQVGVRQVVLARHDDHPGHLADVLVGEAAHAISRKLMEAIGDLLADCPGELRWAIEAAVREPTSVQSVKALAHRARMDRRTCARWFAKAGLPPPSTTLMALRVVYAHRLLQDPGYTVEDVASKLGYAQTRSFATNVKEVLGLTPGEIRVTLSPEETLAIVRERYFSRRPLRLVKAS